MKPPIEITEPGIIPNQIPGLPPPDPGTTIAIGPVAATPTPQQQDNSLLKYLLIGAVIYLVIKD